MAGKIKIPEGPRAVTPYLTVKGAARALEFYTKAFGAKETYRLAEPSGRIGHAEFEISGSPIMISDEYLEMDVRSPETLGGSPVGIHVYVDDVDTFVARAAEHGATIRRAVQDQFYGERTAMLVDPFGHVWHVSTRIEELSGADVKKRYDEMMKQPS